MLLCISPLLQRKLASLCSFPQSAISSAPPGGHGWCGHTGAPIRQAASPTARSPFRHPPLLIALCAARHPAWVAGRTDTPSAPTKSSSVTSRVSVTAAADTQADPLPNLRRRDIRAATQQNTALASKDRHQCGSPPAAISERVFAPRSGRTASVSPQSRSQLTNRFIDSEQPTGDAPGRTSSGTHPNTAAGHAPTPSHVHTSHTSRTALDPSKRRSRAFHPLTRPIRASGFGIRRGVSWLYALTVFTVRRPGAWFLPKTILATRFPRSWRHRRQPRSG